jgi:hypothetical protein
MARRDARCPQCHAVYSWGTTVCPACHVGLDLSGGKPRGRPTVLIFETWDRPSADVVASLLEANGVPCLVRGSEDAMHFGIGPADFWRVFVQASDEPVAQEILDAEIGREDVEDGA